MTLQCPAVRHIRYRHHTESWRSCVRRLVWRSNLGSHTHGNRDIHNLVNGDVTKSARFYRRFDVYLTSIYPEHKTRNNCCLPSDWYTGPEYDKLVDLLDNYIVWHCHFWSQQTLLRAPESHIRSSQSCTVDVDLFVIMDVTPKWLDGKRKDNDLRLICTDRCRWSRDHERSLQLT